jgi:hypothetical protein
MQERPPESNRWSPIPAFKGRLSDYWIGGLPVYQAGGPPLYFEKTGLSLLRLRGSPGGTLRYRKRSDLGSSGGLQFLDAWFLDERASWSLPLLIF